MLINKTDMKVNKIQIPCTLIQSLAQNVFDVFGPPVGFPNTTLIVPPQL